MKNTRWILEPALRWESYSDLRSLTLEKMLVSLLGSVSGGLSVTGKVNMTSAYSSFNGRPTTKGWRCYSKAGLQWQKIREWLLALQNCHHRGKIVTTVAFIFQEQREQILPLFWGQRIKFFMVMEPWGTVFKMANGKLAYVHLHESAEN